jgi:hypothetical protein
LVWDGLPFWPGYGLFKSRHGLRFYETSDGFNGNTIELTQRVGGNLSTSSGSEADFHGVPPNELGTENGIILLPGIGGFFSVHNETEFSLTPEITGIWIIYTAENGNSDPYLEIYDSDGILISSDDDGGSGLNAHITVHLKTDMAYIIIARCIRESADGFILLVERNDELGD